MQTISLIDVTLDYHRQQLLLEAAHDRLASPARPPSNARHSRPIGRFLPRLSLAVVLLVASIAAPVGGGLPAYASGNTVDVDLNTTYNIATIQGLNIVATAGTDDASVTQSGASGDDPGLWRFQPITTQNGTTQYEIVNLRALNKCLSVYYNSLQQGAGLVQYDCHGWQDQEWQVVPEIIGGASVFLRSRSSQYVVDVPGGTPLVGTQLDVWGFNDGLNQAWTLTAL